MRCLQVKKRGQEVKIPLFIQKPLSHPIQTEFLAKVHKKRKES